MEKETSLPGGGSLRHAVSVETAARTEIEGDPMAWDYSHAGKRPIDLRYADAIGGGKATVPNAPQSCCPPPPVLADRRAGSSGPATAILEPHLIFASD